MDSQNLHCNAYGAARDMDRFSYHYVPGINKLDHVTDLGTDYNYLDIKTGQTGGTYTYNPIGQMTGDAAEGNFIRHDVYGMPTAVYWDAGQTTMKASYTYDESGQRIKKTNYGPTGQLLSETYYLRDAFGSIQETRLLEAGESAPTAQDITISGLGRIGFYDRTDGEHRYELTDHLGNIRVTFKEDQHGDAEVLSATDYYPYGMELPGRGLLSSDLASAKGYQGIFAEKDRHLNWSTFDLRTYDGRLGRFHNEDPYGEFHSPFMAMGNNPLSFVDPTGGSTDPDCCPGYYLGSTPVYGSPPGSGGGYDGNIGWDDFVDVNRPAGWAFDRDAVYGPWHDDFLHGHFGSSAPDPEAHAQQQRELVVDHFAELSQDGPVGPTGPTLDSHREIAQGYSTDEVHPADLGKDDSDMIIKVILHNMKELQQGRSDLHLYDVVKKGSKRPTGSRLLDIWDGIFGGGFITVQKGNGTYEGVKIQWVILYGDPDLKGSNDLRFVGIEEIIKTPYAPNVYQIKMYNSGYNDPRIILNMNSENDRQKILDYINP